MVGEDTRNAEQHARTIRDGNKDGVSRHGTENTGESEKGLKAQGSGLRAQGSGLKEGSEQKFAETRLWLSWKPSGRTFDTRFGR